MASLAVIGAGPKALAIAAKRQVLKDLNFEVPELVVIEKKEIGTNWSGKGGFTDGERPLGTPPEKDIGFPYKATIWHPYNAKVDAAMANFSWHRHLVHEGKYGEWVDRGRPQPSHRDWWDYLKWVAAAIPLNPIEAELRKIDIEKSAWILSCELKDGKLIEVSADGLVMTGQGSPIPRPELANTKYFDPITFWQNIDQFKEMESSTVAIIGAGETAAAMICALLEVLPDSSSIKVISPHGHVFTRGENYTENRLYTEPHGWEGLRKDHRELFIQRTDRGVFSVHAQQQINSAGNVELLPGREEDIRIVGESFEVIIKYNDVVEAYAFDAVVDSSNVNPIWYSSLLTDRAAGLITRAVGKIAPDSFDWHIDKDLSVSGLSPKLHLPMQAGLSQGPGFPNLSCLGLLSDRILEPFTKATVAA